MFRCDSSRRARQSRVGQGPGGQALVTMPFPLRFPLAFDGKLLGQVLRIFTDTVAAWYQRRHVVRGFSHAASRSEVVPPPATPPPEPAELDKPANKSRYIPWAELLR
jgi:hypothetical protein